MDSKKYYYLKLKDNFFDSDSIIILESMKDGYVYSNILMKLYLRSLKNMGKLMLNDFIPYNSTMLATVTRHSVGDIEKAVNVFSDLGLVEVMDNGAMYMMDIQLYIGQSSSEADRIRDYRAKIDSEKQGEITSGDYSICTNVVQTYTIDKDIDIVKNINKDTIKTQTKLTGVDSDAKEVLDYLNQKSGRSFKALDCHLKFITSRFSDGFTNDDMKRVVDLKVSKWKGDPKWSEYLRPKTLFGTNFDSYLQECPKPISKPLPIEQLDVEPEEGSFILDIDQFMQQRGLGKFDDLGRTVH